MSGVRYLGPGIWEREARRAVIQFDKVELRYPGSPAILSDVSFAIEERSFQFITGASGAGKSSLLKLMYLGLKPSRGAIIEYRPAEGVDLGVNHAVTLTVRDSAAIFAAEENPDSGLPMIGRVKGPSQRRLRIAFAPDPINGASLDAETRAAIERTAELCRV